MILVFRAQLHLGALLAAGLLCLLELALVLGVVCELLLSVRHLLLAAVRRKRHFAFRFLALRLLARNVRLLFCLVYISCIFLNAFLVVFSLIYTLF